MANGPAEFTSRFISLPMQAMIVVVAVVMMLLLRRRRSRKDPLKRYLIPDPPRDTVVLHQYGKGYTVPSISPFVMKLETYLKVANIRYINKYSRRPGPKGKLPWIQYNDQVVADSQFCIEFLNQEKKIDLNRHLKPDQLAIGHLVRRTVEESLYWAMVTWRLLLEKTGLVYKKLGLPSALVWYLRRAARSGLRSQGIGRHSEQEVMQMMDQDLQALSQILGDKQFFFGNQVSQVTEFECAVFGQLSQLVWQMPGTPVENTMAEKYPNLVEFCERMKSAFWPEWDDRIIYQSDASSAESSSTLTDQQRQCQQISSESNVPINAVDKNTISRAFTSFLPGRTSSARGGAVTGTSHPFARSAGSESITDIHDKEKLVPGVLNIHRSHSDNTNITTRTRRVPLAYQIHNNRSDNKSIATQASQLRTSSILTQKPTLCLQQQYYHDLMTF